MVPITISAERWEQLYRLEFARVYRALLAVLRDPDRALDAIQDAFVAGLRKPPAEDDDLAGWLFVVAARSRRPRLGPTVRRPGPAPAPGSRKGKRSPPAARGAGRLLPGAPRRTKAM